MILGTGLRLKDKVDQLILESPKLQEFGVMNSVSTLKGLNNQCDVAILQKQRLGMLFIATLKENSYHISSFLVDWKLARNLIRTYL